MNCNRVPLLHAILTALCLCCIDHCVVLGQAKFFQRYEQAPEIIQAAKANQWSKVEELLDENGERIKEKSQDGMTILHFACLGNRAELVRKVLELHSDPDAKTSYGVTPLAIACGIGSREIVELLIEHDAQVDLKVNSGETPLMIASRQGDVAIVEELLAAGADPNAKEKRSQTALMWAAAAGNAKVVEALLDANAEIDVSVPSGFDALKFAARNGHTEVVTTLVDRGADVNAVMHPRNTSGRAPRDAMSPLMLAVESAHFELAIKLIEMGADPNDQRSGFAPLHAISWVRRANLGDGVDGDPEPRGSGKLTSLAFVREIVARGADVNLQLEQGQGGKAKLNLRGATPFLMAAKTADLPLLKTLIDCGADPLATNVDGTTALIACAGVGVIAVGEEPGSEQEVNEVIRFLLDCGLDINAKDENGETVMHGAAYRNYPSTVKTLADLGADPTVWNEPNRWTWTPIMIASGKRPGSFKPSPETIRALEQSIRDH